MDQAGGSITSRKVVMEDKICHPQPRNEESTGILRTLREVPPSHYIFKIDSFSSLLETGLEKYESGVFDVGGCKWKLSLYPNGDTKRNGSGHISLYLALANTDVTFGWEVNVNFKFFVFDQIRDKYLTIQDSGGIVRHFHKMKTEWGFAELLSLKVFNDSNNGYLVDDCCAFGAEIFVIKGTGRGETLSMIKAPKNGRYSWKIEKYSTLSECVYSDMFTFGGRKWKLLLYPKGNSKETSSPGLSLYLLLDRSETLPPMRKLYAKYKLRVKEQLFSNHYEKSASYWFDTPGIGLGYDDFMSLSDFKNISKSYLLNDSLIVEVQIDFISMIKDFP